MVYTDTRKYRSYTGNSPEGTVKKVHTDARWLRTRVKQEFNSHCGKDFVQILVKYELAKLHPRFYNMAKKTGFLERLTALIADSIDQSTKESIREYFLKSVVRSYLQKYLFKIVCCNVVDSSCGKVIDRYINIVARQYLNLLIQQIEIIGTARKPAGENRYSRPFHTYLLLGRIKTCGDKSGELPDSL